VTAISGKTFFREWKKNLRKMFEETDTILILGLSALLVFFLKEGFLEQLKDERDGLVAAQHEYLEENALFNIRFDAWKLKQETAYGQSDEKESKRKRVRSRESTRVTTPDTTLQASLASLEEGRELVRKQCEIEKDLSLATIRTEERDTEFQNTCDGLADAYKFTQTQGATKATEIERVRTRIDFLTKNVSKKETETETTLQQSRRFSEEVSRFCDTLTTFIFRTLLILSIVSLVAKLVGKDETVNSE
jgi:hypothetical protein